MTTKQLSQLLQLMSLLGHDEVVNFIHSSYSLKPQGLMMNELKWKYLIRSVRGKNILMTGWKVVVKQWLQVFG